MRGHVTNVNPGARRPVGAAVVLLSGVAAVVALGLTRRDLPEIVAVIGATMLLAWTVERGRRFLGGGCILFGLGVGLTVAEHVDKGNYRDQFIFAGIAAGLLAVRALNPPVVWGAALALLSLALFEFTLQYLPPILSLGRLYGAFNDGWAFGVLIGLEGLVVLFTAGRARRGARQPLPLRQP